MRIDFYHLNSVEHSTQVVEVVEMGCSTQSFNINIDSRTRVNLAGCGKIVLSELFLPSLCRFVSLESRFVGISCCRPARRVHFRAVRRHYDPDFLRRSGHQVSHAHQVISRTSEGKHPIHFQRSAMPHLAE